jgi:hypothetical protein
MHDERGSKVMTEAVTALCLFFSMSIFVAHAIDALAPSAHWETDTPDE